MTPAAFIGTGFGSGLIPPLVPKNKVLRLICKPFRPGTYGSTAAMAVAWILFHWNLQVIYLVASVFIFFAGWWSIAGAEKWLDVRNDWKGFMRWRDQNEITIDEWAGVFAMLSPFVVTGFRPHWIAIIAGFAAFRFADALKPPLVWYYERQETAWGVMMDDVAAGIVYGMLTILAVDVIIFSLPFLFR